MQIKSPDDFIKLQHDLDRFVEWFSRIELSLIIEKCNFMTYTRSTTLFYNSYSINDSNLSYTDESVLDFGF